MVTDTSQAHPNLCSVVKEQVLHKPNEDATATLV